MSMSGSLSITTVIAVARTCATLATALGPCANTEVFASQLVTVDAVRPLSVECCEALTPQQVLGVRHWLQVIGVDAGSVAAQMVNLKPIGDGADVVLIRPSMRQEPVDGGVRTGMDFAVTGSSL
jgi:hypothetical protein